MTILLLPADIFRLIESFLTKSDYHYFLNTSKEHFTCRKKERMYFALSSSRSREYILSPAFRELLLSKVVNGWKQISVSIDDGRIDLPRDLPVHRVKLETTSRHWRDLTHFSHVESVGRGATCTGTYIPPIPAVKELKLAGCPSLTDVSNLSHLSKLEMGGTPSLIDISPLQNIPHLSFDGGDNIEDFSVFNASRQKFLKIYCSSLLRDVTSFSGIRYLILQSCPELENVSPLKGIYDLSLLSCAKVMDISGLGNHHRLVIKDCSYGLTGYDSLVNIPHVRLRACSISDVSVLSHATTVSLLQCREVVDVAPLRGLRSLTIDDSCDAVLNIDSLCDIPNLSLSYRKEIPDLRQLANKRLSLQYITKDAFPHPIEADYFSFFKNILELSIFQCDNIVRLIGSGRVEYFQHLQSLSIQGSMVLWHVNGLGSIPNLRISHCYALTNISALGRNRCVVLEECRSLVDVSPLATVPVVDIQYCNKVKDYSCLSKVQRLSLKVRKVWS